ncbi:tRNA (guanine(10)-N2)-methyltransferase [Cyphellophora attinorum]|uniref:tRNA (guanine(10)-N(2))-methyltransferase n=1 Tax=Cyphellophora attinorum TaxID=1664694 RepID=A0A0N1HD32_9EURO|nr:tRNA (guanine(10)-N2)-methyltransferase [Phialophora attinorum]KPI42075.1 tRNA (guanine(10)-N2)-methyltransferase [Phialophora attinorum]
MAPQLPLYLIRFSQTHTSFRPAELEALERLLNESLRKAPGNAASGFTEGLAAHLRGRGIAANKVRIEVEVVRYEDGSPFCLVRFRLYVRSSQKVGRPATISNGVEQSQTTAEEGLHVAGVQAEDSGTELEVDEVLLSYVAQEFVRRAVQAKGIYEIWGLAGAGLQGHLVTCRGTGAMPNTVGVPPDDSGPVLPSPKTPLHPLYSDLHTSTRKMSQHRWTPYQNSATLKFKFTIDSFNHSRSSPDQRDIINSFAYLDFGGQVRMKDANQEWVVFEEWEGPPSLPISDGLGEVAAFDNTRRELRRLYFGRTISTKTLRPLIERHDLKKRPYISTTSMDAELALMTANVALAGPGKIFLDPFCGTGGFLVAAAELGAWVLGSDIDGRSFRGKSDHGLDAGVGKNVKKYGLQDGFGGCLTSDLVNTPFQTSGRRWLDGIISDPPYGVREGLKVLGTRNGPVGLDHEDSPRTPHLIDGVPAHTLPGYVAPKKPYSFERMLGDVLDFAARTLVDGGRLAFWMPSANEDELGRKVEVAVPKHHALILRHVCVQRFNRWSRSLLVYERRPGDLETLLIDGLKAGVAKREAGSNKADDLNPFRRRYFQAFTVHSNEDTGG